MGLSPEERHKIYEEEKARIEVEQKKLLEAYDIDGQRSTLETQLKRLGDLYQWGRKTRAEYLADSNAIRRQLQKFKPNSKDTLERLASFLKDITRAWDQASQLQRNRLLKYLLETVWIKDKKVIAVTPQPQFVPFFDLQYDGKSNYTLAVRPRGDSNPRSPP